MAGTEKARRVKGRWQAVVGGGGEGWWQAGRKE